jgi:nucleoid-associated protein YgaU
LRGSVRQGVAIGSVVAVVLLAAATGALVFRGGGMPQSEPTQQQAAVRNEATPAPSAREDQAVRPAAPIPPSFDVVKISPSGTAVIAGRAEPGAKVVVRDGGTPIGEVTADRRGEWVLVIDHPLGPGDRLLSAEASNGAGGAVIKSEENVAVSISPTAPAGRAGETALAVVLPSNGSAARVLQRPESAPSGGPNMLTMDAADYDKEGRVTLSGRAAPRTTVQIYLGNEPLATATTDDRGVWSVVSPGAVPPQGGELRVDQLAADGRVLQRVALPLARNTAAEPAPGESYVVQRGNSLWQIARRVYGAGTRYTVIYSANPDQIRDPNRIYPGQIFKLPKS